MTPDPVVPLSRKLGLRPGGTLTLLSAPAGWEVLDLPPGVEVRRSKGEARRRAAGNQVTVAFFTRREDLVHQAPSLVAGLPGDAALWVAWPRRAAGHRSDITDNVVRETLLPLGLVDVKVAALGEDWSGLRFVWPKHLRPRPS